MLWLEQPLQRVLLWKLSFSAEGDLSGGPCSGHGTGFGIPCAHTAELWVWCEYLPVSACGL